MSEYSRPIYRSLRLDHFETPRHVPDLIRDSELLRYIKTHNITIIETLSVRTLRVREQCRHDRDTSPVNNQQRDLDAHIGSYIFYEDLYRSDRITTYVSSLCHRYVTYPRFDRRYPIPSSISLPVSLFTRSIIHHLTTNILVAVLARLMLCALPRGPRDTSPTIGVTNPNLEIRQPNIYLWRHL